MWPWPFKELPGRKEREEKDDDVMSATGTPTGKVLYTHKAPVHDISRSRKGDAALSQETDSRVRGCWIRALCRLIYCHTALSLAATRVLPAEQPAGTPPACVELCPMVDLVPTQLVSTALLAFVVGQVLWHNVLGPWVSRRRQRRDAPSK